MAEWRTWTSNFLWVSKRNGKEMKFGWQLGYMPVVANSLTFYFAVPLQIYLVPVQRNPKIVSSMISHAGLAFRLKHFRNASHVPTSM